eukprot:358866-Chlamydomonas_euryale.AAC.9
MHGTLNTCQRKSAAQGVWPVHCAAHCRAPYGQCVVWHTAVHLMASALCGTLPCTLWPVCPG